MNLDHLLAGKSVHVLEALKAWLVLRPDGRYNSYNPGEETHFILMMGASYLGDDVGSTLVGFYICLLLKEGEVGVLILNRLLSEICSSNNDIGLTGLLKGLQTILTSLPELTNEIGIERFWKTYLERVPVVIQYGARRYGLGEKEHKILCLNYLSLLRLWQAELPEQYQSLRQQLNSWRTMQEFHIAMEALQKV